MSQWMPIESAPRDGSWFVVYGCGFYYAVNWPEGRDIGGWHLIDGEWRAEYIAEAALSAQEDA